jgi:hypothetical protein
VAASDGDAYQAAAVVDGGAEPDTRIVEGT